jgi:hypothetical protein
MGQLSRSVAPAHRKLQGYLETNSQTLTAEQRREFLQALENVANMQSGIKALSYVQSFLAKFN